MGKRESSEWLRFAEDDLEAAKYLTGMPKRKLEIICYHCQQCAEKAVKSLYALLDIEIPRTHDLKILSSNLKGAPDFSEHYSSLAILQPFAVTVRYPYKIELIPGDEVKAIAAAEAILFFCRFFEKHDINSGK